MCQIFEKCDGVLCADFKSFNFITGISKIEHPPIKDNMRIALTGKSIKGVLNAWIKASSLCAKLDEKAASTLLNGSKKISSSRRNTNMYGQKENDNETQCKCHFFQ